MTTSCLHYQTCLLIQIVRKLWFLIPLNYVGQLEGNVIPCICNNCAGHSGRHQNDAGKEEGK